MNLANLDLNLLVTLDALLEQRSVSRAAEQLGLSQPAVSAQLARLRRHFGDELLARFGNQYRLTPLASAAARARATRGDRGRAGLRRRTGLQPGDHLPGVLAGHE